MRHNHGQRLKRNQPNPKRKAALDDAFRRIAEERRFGRERTNTDLADAYREERRRQELEDRRSGRDGTD